MKINVDTLQKKQKQDSSLSLDFSFNKIIKPLNNKRKHEFYREFSTLLKSGVDFNQALSILTEQQKNKAVKNIYRNINNDVVKGKSLFETLKEDNSFSPYEYYSVKIGEETKRLPEIFDQLQKFFERKIKMKRQITSVLTYPIFVLVITFGVLYFMLNYVVPMFSKVFMQFGKKLPEITQLVVKLSKNFNSVFLIFLLVIISIILLHKYLKRYESYKFIFSRFLMKIPFFGSIIKKIQIARFCQSLSLLLSTKTPLVTSLDLLEKMITFYPLKYAIKESKKDILKGETFANSLNKHEIFPTKLLTLTKIGEDINKLDEVYDGLSSQYNEEIDHSTKIIGTILEPMMIIIIGGVVGFIMIAMYSPLFGLSEILEK